MQNIKAHAGRYFPAFTFGRCYFNARASISTSGTIYALLCLSGKSKKNSYHVAASRKQELEDWLASSQASPG
jgi:hypothetical protein